MKKILVILAYALCITSYAGEIAQTMKTVAIIGDSLTRMLPEQYQPKMEYLRIAMVDSYQIVDKIEVLVPYFKNNFKTDAQKLHTMLMCASKPKMAGQACTAVKCNNQKQCIAQTLRHVSTMLKPISENILGKVTTTKDAQGKIVNQIDPGLCMIIASSKLLPENKRVDLSDYTLKFSKIYDLLSLISMLLSPEIATENITPEQEKSFKNEPFVIKEEEAFTLE